MKKIFVCVLAAVVALSLFAACGKSGGENGGENGGGESALDVTAIKTIAEAKALDGKGTETSAFSDKVYVYCFELNGSYWRLIAEMSEEESAALWALDMGDPDYDAKTDEITSKLAVTKCEDLTGQKLTDDQIASLVGKTGEALVSDGWIDGMGYNLDEMEFFLEKGAFSYTVKFEAGTALENTDDLDVLEAIKPLTIKSIEFGGFGGSATEIDENGEF